MSPEEAIAAAAGKDCFLVFHCETGEVLSVRPAGKAVEEITPAQERRKREVPTVGRLYPAGSVTLEALASQAADCRKECTRGRQLDELTRMPAPELVDLLEGKNALPTELSLPADAGILLRSLLELHREELTPELAARVAQVGSRFPEHGDELEVRLADVRGDREALWRIWPGKEALNPAVFQPLLEAYARLGESSPGYIEGLVRMIETRNSFLLWFPAVTALGRVGPAAAPAAAALKRRHEFESRHAIIAVLDRAVARIESSPDAWVACGCANGYVLERGPERWSRRTCPACLGLAWVGRPDGT